VGISLLVELIFERVTLTCFCRYYNIDTNFVVNENGSPDEGFGELNVSGLINTQEYILPDIISPERKFGSGKVVDKSLLFQYVFLFN